MRNGTAFWRVVGIMGAFVLGGYAQEAFSEAETMPTEQQAQKKETLHLSSDPQIIEQEVQRLQALYDQERSKVEQLEKEALSAEKRNYQLENSRIQALEALEHLKKVHKKAQADAKHADNALSQKTVAKASTVEVEKTPEVSEKTASSVHLSQHLSKARAEYEKVVENFRVHYDQYVKLVKRISAVREQRDVVRKKLDLFLKQQQLLHKQRFEAHVQEINAQLGDEREIVSEKKSVCDTRKHPKEDCLAETCRMALNDVGGVWVSQMTTVLKEMDQNYLIDDQWISAERAEVLRSKILAERLQGKEASCRVQAVVQGKPIDDQWGVLTVTAHPSESVRIMNIRGHYRPEMLLPFGEYRIQITDAAGKSREKHIVLDRLFLETTVALAPPS
ncbi:hypothetical protein ACQZV8_15830 [Magnetococcales bacterium HHB-1]